MLVFPQFSWVIVAAQIVVLLDLLSIRPVGSQHRAIGFACDGFCSEISDLDCKTGKSYYQDCILDRPDQSILSVVCKALASCFPRRCLKPLFWPSLLAEALVEKLCITLGMARHFGVDRGFQGSGFMDAEVGFHGLWVLVQIVDPRVVALLLSLIDHGISIRKKRGNGVSRSWSSVALKRTSSILESRASMRLRRLSMKSSSLRHLPAPGRMEDLELLLRARTG